MFHILNYLLMYLYIFSVYAFVYFYSCICIILFEFRYFYMFFTLFWIMKDLNALLNELQIFFRACHMVFNFTIKFLSFLIHGNF